MTSASAKARQRWCDTWLADTGHQRPVDIGRVRKDNRGQVANTSWGERGCSCRGKGQAIGYCYETLRIFRSSFRLSSDRLIGQCTVTT
jgi:hypothetical protein